MSCVLPLVKGHVLESTPNLIHVSSVSIPVTSVNGSQRVSAFSRVFPSRVFYTTPSPHNSATYESLDYLPFALEQASLILEALDIL